MFLRMFDNDFGLRWQIARMPLVVDEGASLWDNSRTPRLFNLQPCNGWFDGGQMDSIRASRFLIPNSDAIGNYKAGFGTKLRHAGIIHHWSAKSPKWFLDGYLNHALTLGREETKKPDCADLYHCPQRNATISIHSRLPNCKIWFLDVYRG